MSALLPGAQPASYLMWPEIGSNPLWPCKGLHKQIQFWIQVNWLHRSCQTPPAVMKWQQFSAAASPSLVLFVSSFCCLLSCLWKCLHFLVIPLFCRLPLPPHWLSAMMQLLFIHQGLKLLMKESRQFLADSHLTFVFLIFFWTRHHQSSAWLQLGLIGCISAEC